MSFYLDTSVLVAAATAEVKTDEVQRWLARQSADELLASDWSITEFSAALSIKLRERQIELNLRRDALALFARLCAENLTILPVLSSHFPRAAAYCDRHEYGLRAGDALHLAIAAENGATLVTLDKRQHRAGSALGIRTNLL